MGRWAQSKHRGGGAAVAAPLLPAPGDTDWDFVPVVTIPLVQKHGEASNSGLGPVGTDGFILRWNVDGGPWTTNASFVDGNVSTTDEETFGSDINGQLAYALGATRVSEWSTTKTV